MTQGSVATGQRPGPQKSMFLSTAGGPVTELVWSLFTQMHKSHAKTDGDNKPNYLKGKKNKWVN